MSSFTLRTAAPVMGLTVLALSIGGVALRVHADEADKPGAITAKLTLDPSALDLNGKPVIPVGYYPLPLPLSADKPATVKKEPTYKGTPKYATLHLGNGPNSNTVVVVDTPAEGDAKIYVDANHNGDLTDDGDGAWKKKTPGTGRTQYGVNSYVVNASWGTADKETSSGTYGVGIYFFVAKDPMGKVTENLFYMRTAARTGTLTLNGKPHKVALIENDGDGIYSKPVETDDKGAPVKPPKTRPVWMAVDINDDGKYGLSASTPIADIRAPFEFAGKVYEAKVTEDGSTLTIMPTKRAVATLTPKPAPRPELLKAGTVAPNFNSEKFGGGSLQLADYKGKIVIVDFWATWCGPCQRSMPHIEQVYKAVKDQNVAVVGVCVWDDKAAYEKWVPENKDKYTFTFAFDPAGKDNAKSIASSMFKVSGIPTTYIIDKDGKVADAIVGYQDGDTRVEAALKKLGVTVPEKHASIK